MREEHRPTGPSAIVRPPLRSEALSRTLISLGSFLSMVCSLSFRSIADSGRRKKAAKKHTFVGRGRGGESEGGGGSQARHLFPFAKEKEKFFLLMVAFPFVKPSKRGSIFLQACREGTKGRTDGQTEERAGAKNRSWKKRVRAKKAS